jgi:SAM-dependent methyltransferase
MFFPERILGITKGDRVLEIGPGSTPCVHATEFLEYSYASELDAIKQRGDITRAPDFNGRKIHYYSGGEFPFSTGDFDYVIASHVIEHVEQPEFFAQEIFRVGRGRGYMEFPLPPYEYIFDFDVHLNFIWRSEDGDGIRYIPKASTTLGQFGSITSELRRSLELGWDDLVANNLDHFFHGFEFLRPFEVRRAEALTDFARKFSKDGRGIVRRVARKFSAAFG